MTVGQTGFWLRLAGLAALTATVLLLAACQAADTPEPEPDPEAAADAPDPEPDPEVLAPQAEGGTLSAGHFHTCGLTADGTPACWGRDGTSSRPDGLALTAISAGGQHTCGLAADGTPACWGVDSDGQSSPPDGLTLAVP